MQPLLPWPHQLHIKDQRTQYTIIQVYLAKQLQFSISTSHTSSTIETELQATNKRIIPSICPSTNKSSQRSAYFQHFLLLKVWCCVWWQFIRKLLTQSMKGKYNCWEEKMHRSYHHFLLLLNESNLIKRTAKDLHCMKSHTTNPAHSTLSISFSPFHCFQL